MENLDHTARGKHFLIITVPAKKNNLFSKHIGQEKISVRIDIQIRSRGNKNRICKHHFSFQCKNVVNMRNGRNIFPIGA